MTQHLFSAFEVAQPRDTSSHIAGFSLEGNNWINVHFYLGIKKCRSLATFCLWTWLALLMFFIYANIVNVLSLGALLEGRRRASASLKKRKERNKNYVGSETLPTSIKERKPPRV